MIRFIGMDEKLTLSAQMEENAGLVAKSMGQPMPHFLNKSQISFLHNFIAAWW